MDDQKNTTVCMVNDSFFRASGSAIAIRRITEALPEIDYYFAGSGDRQPEDLSWMPAGHYQFFKLKTANPSQMLAEIFRFKTWMKQIHCDLVHCHHRRLAVLLQLSGLPVLYTAHNAFAKSAWFRWLRPKKMTAVTQSVADNMRQITGLDVLAVIGNPAVFPPSAPAYSWQAVRSRAVCIARLDPVKGHTHLLSAWKLLLQRGYQCELDLVGEGPLRPQLEEQAQRDGIAHLVHFHGFCARPAGIIENSLFAILVSQTEGQGLVTLEAAAAARPSLLTAVPGSIDLLPPDRRLPNGLAFADVPATAAALEEWFAHPEAVADEGKLFFNFLRNSGDSSRIASEYKAVYKSLQASATPV